MSEKFNPADSLGAQPRWRIALYLLRINAAYVWGRLRSALSPSPKTGA